MRLLFISIAILLAACSHRLDPSEGFHSTITFGHKGSLDVVVADERHEQARGLMGVSALGADRGMAFDFGSKTSGSFWMKDTLIPLSIAFVDEDLRVIDVLEMEPCHADPCPRYGVDGPYILAIEANSGWFRRHGIEAGDRITTFEGPFYG